MLTTEEHIALENAVLAYNEGKYEEAYKIFLDFAVEKNDDESQYYLGLMYKFGEYVEQDDEQAISWWKKSAHQRNMDARFQLESISMTKNTRFYLLEASGS